MSSDPWLSKPSIPLLLLCFEILTWENHNHNHGGNNPPCGCDTEENTQPGWVVSSLTYDHKHNAPWGLPGHHGNNVIIIYCISFIHPPAIHLGLYLHLPLYSIFTISQAPFLVSADGCVFSLTEETEGIWRGPHTIITTHPAPPVATHSGPHPSIITDKWPVLLG